MTSMKKTDIESLIREASMMIRMWEQPVYEDVNVRIKVLERRGRRWTRFTEKKQSVDDSYEIGKKIKVYHERWTSDKKKMVLVDSE